MTVTMEPGRTGGKAWIAPPITLGWAIGLPVLRIGLVAAASVLTWLIVQSIEPGSGLSYLWQRRLMPIVFAHGLVDLAFTVPALAVPFLLANGG